MPKFVYDKMANPHLMPVLPRMRLLSEEEWAAILKKSIHQNSLGGMVFPRFPSDQIQRQFVGSSNESALDEALTTVNCWILAVAGVDFYVFSGEILNQKISMVLTRIQTSLPSVIPVA